MRILIVNCYEESRQGQIKFRAFHRLICGWFAESKSKDAVGNLDVVIRRPNDLHDCVIDWEFDRLDIESIHIARRFDNLSLIIVIGDMSMCPWSMDCAQLVTLLWMAEFSKKPTLCIGSGAFAAIYSAAGHGTKFNVLNGPIGDSVERIPTFPRYSKTLGQHPGVLLENETGDMYTYNSQYNTWAPVCNIGIYRLAMRGKPVPVRYRQKEQHWVADDLNRSKKLIKNIPEPLGDNEFMAHIRSKFVNHFAFRDLSSMSFVCALIPDWYLSLEGSLPANGGVVAADTKFGPVIIIRELSLYLAAEVGEDLGHAAARLILKNYFHHIISVCGLKADAQMGDSVVTFLFGPNGKGGGTYDSIKHKKIWTGPASHTVIACVLPRGPKRIEIPVGELPQSAPTDDSQPAKAKISQSETTRQPPKLSLTRPEQNKYGTENSNGCNSPRSSNLIRDPQMNRSKRLENFFINTGNKQMIFWNNELAKITAQGDQYDIDNKAPNSARDIFIGLRADKGKESSRSKSPIERDSQFSPRIDVVDDSASPEASPPRSAKSRQRPKSAHTLSSTNLKQPPTPIIYDPKDRPPLTKTSTFNETLEKGHLPLRRPQTAGRVVSAVEILPRQISKPFNNKEKFDKILTDEENIHVSEYDGMFHGGHLNAYEKERKEYKKKKEKFIGGDFLRHFGIASQLPLRQPGHVRPHGNFPENAPSSMHMTPLDWHHVREHNPEKHVSEHPWKPTTIKTTKTHKM